MVRYWHPKHGHHVVGYNEDLAALEAAGWTREAPAAAPAPAPEPAAEPVPEPDPVPEPPPAPVPRREPWRKRGR